VIKIQKHFKLRRADLDLSIPIPRDDWPHLYLRSRTLANPYIAFTMGATIFALLAIGFVLPRPFTSHPHFLFLGAGFMLIQTSAITRLCLVFGSTWHVVSIVVSCIMILLLIGNLIADRIRRPPIALLYVILLLMVTAQYVLPLESLLQQSLVARIVLAGGFMTAPLLMAGIIFPTSFRESKTPASALGWNLFGAVLGGMVEYVSLITGLAALALISGAFYLLSAAALRRARAAPP